MDLVVHLTLFFGGLAVLLLIGLPVAIAFTLVNLVGVYVFWGGTIGLSQLILSIDSSDKHGCPCGRPRATEAPWPDWPCSE
jgi:hypothetical protein